MVKSSKSVKKSRSKAGKSKLHPKTLSTGQTIYLSTQDEKNLKALYDYMSGSMKRSQVEALISAKRNELIQYATDMPSSARLLLQQRGQGSDDNNNHHHNQIPVISELKSEAEYKVSKYFSTREELSNLEEKLKLLIEKDYKITHKDIDHLLKQRGVTYTKRQIDQMIWEVDEKLDGVIDLDEFLLTYYRNVTDTTGAEPHAFFRLMDFMLFDEQNKGYVIEDDCMVVLFERYGGVNLEKEIKFLFGSKLRAEGGDGTIDLAGFLSVMTSRSGKRSLFV